MLVTWLGHAQLFVNVAGATVLIDPWFHEPIFEGAWFRYPPAPFPTASALPPPDVLVLTCDRADHAGEETLRQLPVHTRVFAMASASGVLLQRLARVGFTRVSWLQSYETARVAAGLALTLAPGLGEAAMALLEGDGVRLLHGASAPFDPEACRTLSQRLGPVDLAFLPYAHAATPFGPPTADSARVREAGLRRFTDALEGLAPREAVPFAAGYARLEACELENDFRSRASSDEALMAAAPAAAAKGCHLLRMEPGDAWSPEIGVDRKGLVAQWPQTREAVQRYAAQEKPRVEAALQHAHRA